MRINNLFKLPAIALALLVTSISAYALDGAVTYQPAAFEKAQQADKMIVVDIYKDGCGTCAKQKPALEAARAMYPEATFFRVDFASDKKAVKKFSAVKQSTIIVFKGAEEKGRVLGETNKEKILAMIAKGAS